MSCMKLSQFALFQCAVNDLDTLRQSIGNLFVFIPTHAPSEVLQLNSYNICAAVYDLQPVIMIFVLFFSVLDQSD